MTELGVSKTDYSRIADYYDQVRPPPADIWISRIIEHGEINENSRVLDIGCGTGRFPLGILAQTRAMIYSLEPSIHMLKKAFERAKPKKNLLGSRRRTEITI